MLRYLAAILGFLALGFVPARALDTRRADVHAFIQRMHAEHGLSTKSVRSLLRAAESKQSIIDAMTRPAEAVLPWYEYRERFLTDRRIDKGLQFWTQQAKPLARAEAKTGVSQAAILGILGVETRYGEITGGYRVLDALATLSFDYPPRADFFLGELEQFILLTREEKIDPRTALGSYAGAIGAPQFMPSNYRKLAVDGDGNRRRDLWRSWPDIVMSVANYLQYHGWEANGPVVVSATVAGADLGNFDTSSIRLNETVASLRAKGARFESDLPPETPAMLIVTEGRDGNEYRVGFNNFVALSRYNPRIKYALAVNDLGEALLRAREEAATSPHESP